MIKSLRSGRVPWLAIRCIPASVRRASALSAIKAGLRNSQSVDQFSNQSEHLSPWRQKLREKMERRRGTALSDRPLDAFPVPARYLKRGLTRVQAAPAPAGSLKAKWRNSINEISDKLRTMMRKPATYGLDPQSDNILRLKDEYTLTRGRLKQLAQWYEAALPPILETGLPMLSPNSREGSVEREELKDKQLAMWNRIFEEHPGILGDINREFRLKIRHLQTLLGLPAIRRAEAEPQHRWITIAKASHMGRDGDQGTPGNRALRTASRNNGTQRALRRNERSSQFYRQHAVSWEEMESTSLNHASELDQGHGDLGFGPDKQTGRFDEGPEERQRTGTESAGQHGRESKQTAELEDDSYVPISYTRADSEFLYGANSVLAALKASRRSFHKLYIDFTSQSQESRLRRDQIHQLASDAHIPIDTKDQPGKQEMLDKMSQGRPHNGVVLEASPLPFAPVERIVYNSASESINLVPHQQGVDKGPLYPQLNAARHDGWRQPFVLLLDGILDPGNMGNIIRTAHFYSLTAVAICSKTCAPVGSSVTVKSSSGAIEAIPLINVTFPADFIRNARDNDWNVFAAVAPQESWKQASRHPSTDRVLLTTDTHDLLARKPAILMLGAEGEGLRSIMVNKATHKISIPGGGRQRNDVGVDSLNVASAAAVLIDALVRKPSFQRSDNRSAERFVAIDRGEAPKQAREIQISQNRDTEELEDDEDLPDEEEENDQKPVEKHSSIGNVRSIGRSKVEALNEIDHLRALKKKNRETLAELRAEDRVKNQAEIKRLKKENQRHHKGIQVIKQRKGTKMNSEDVKLVREMIMQGASTLQAQNFVHVPPADAPSSKITKHFSRDKEPGRDSPFKDTAEAAHASPADAASGRVNKQWSTSNEPIYKSFRRVGESGAFDESPEPRGDGGRENGVSRSDGAAEALRGLQAEAAPLRMSKHVSGPNERIIRPSTSPHESSTSGSTPRTSDDHTTAGAAFSRASRSRPGERTIRPAAMSRDTSQSERASQTADDRGGVKRASSFDNVADAFEDFPAEVPSSNEIKPLTTPNESSPSDDNVQRPPTKSEPRARKPMGTTGRARRSASASAGKMLDRMGV